jgi:4-carboxymuconolactone decarboxylase
LKIITIDGFSKNEDHDQASYEGGSREFDGEVMLQRLVSASDSGEVELLAVWFSAGARTRAHIHDKDQILHIVQGQGIVADDHEMRIVLAGQVITIPADTWHWHGATTGSAMMHISIRQQGCKTDWEVDQKNWSNAPLTALK